MTTSAFVLIGFIAWTLALLVLMEVLRSRLVLTKQVPANAFVPDNANLSPFMHRLARAHANCLEGFPIFGGLLIAALVTDRAALTDPLAPWLLLARIAQSCVHVASGSPAAATLRFSLFAVQVAIALFWVWQLLIG